MLTRAAGLDVPEQATSLRQVVNVKHLGVADQCSNGGSGTVACAVEPECSNQGLCPEVAEGQACMAGGMLPLSCVALTAQLVDMAYHYVWRQRLQRWHVSNSCIEFNCHLLPR